MSGIHFSFDAPGWLALLAALPLLWWFSFRSISALGPVRRWFVLALRTAVLVLLVLALAEMQMVRTSQRLAVIYVLDQSVSIPDQQRRAMADYVNADIKKHRRAATDDLAGVIIFGRDAAVEQPPDDENVQIKRTPEAHIETDYTNIAGALKLAMASFPQDAARRVVLVTDGNENLGNALDQARQMAEAGVGIDVVPVRYQARSDVAVERITIPPDVNRGQPFDVRVVLNNTTPATTQSDGVVKGKLEVTRKTADGEKTLATQPVELEPGKRVFSLREEIDSPDFYTYEARFIPDDPAADAAVANNRATTFTHVRGQGQVLLIENFENRGEFDFLVEQLRKENLQVTVRPSDQLFGSLAELQPFDTVLLGDVPREDFSEEQIKMLARNTQQMGSGLVMLGGPNSFGAGGWTGTDVEEAMPVDFQIKNKQVVPIGALAMLMHASEMANGNHWQKKIADAALGSLGNQEYCGVIHWEGTDQWLWTSGGSGILKIGDGDNRNRMLGRIDRMVPGDMPAFDSTLTRILNDFNNLPPEVAVKHTILISDGDPSGPSASVLNGFTAAKIKITTVGIGTHGQPESSKLRGIAAATGGKYYQPNSPNALPRIYQKEARVVSQPLIFERKNGFEPREAFPHEMLKGIPSTLPPITGYVLTNKKDNPLVEIALVSPVGPAASTQANRTILAGWTYGLGKAVALTTDAGKRWASAWTTWPEYDKLFSQIVRWSMRPAGDQGKFTTTTDLVDGKVRVTVTALDKNDEFLNFLNMAGSVVGPDMKPIDLKIHQTAPGRYVGEFDSPQTGSYFLMLSPGAGMAPILTGVNVPYSAEYLDRESNEGLIKSLAGLTPKGSKEQGLLIEDRSGRGMDLMLQFDTYRHNLAKAQSSQDVWHYLVFIAGCLFFADVFVRRVQVNFTWVPMLAGRVRDKILRRHPMPAPEQTIERLRSRKAAIAQQIDQRRAAARFELAADAPAPEAGSLEQPTGELPSAGDKPETGQRGKSVQPETEKADDDYTTRLLKAKKKLRDEQKDKGPRPE
ncbi:MAG TPA: VWA domain-containing protein [Pirellulales bacterium]